MKAALIPAKGYYETALRSDYHLVLAQITDLDYWRMYNWLSDDHFIIVDNGAAEGGSVDDGDLLLRAAAVGADEVVVPDVMKDFKGTIERIDHFFAENETHQEDTSYMLVAQGENFTEVMKAVDYYVTRYPAATIGLPRHLITTLGNMRARAYVLSAIAERYGERPVHLLGVSANHLEEITWVSDRYPWVRGIDSSLPYNMAIEGVDLSEHTAAVSRPDRYFEEVREVNMDLLGRNIDTFMGWASGTEGARS
jgi:hypothetical protein